MIFSSENLHIEWSDIRAFSDEYGRKGGAILALPRCWTPEFALISVEEVQQFVDCQQLSAVISDDVVERIRLFGSEGSEIIVRSSVVGESIWDRGKYCSVRVNCDYKEFSARLDEAARRVVDVATGRELGFVMHRFVNPRQRGEFGNLHRISKTRDHWEISSVADDGSTSRQRLTCQRDQAANPERMLSVRAGLARERLFGSIGAWLNNELLLGRRQRLNCEWVTDNKYYYIVQIDEEDEDLSGVNPFQVRVPLAASPQQAEGRFLKSADEGSIKAWDKLRVLDELWEPEARHKPVLFVVPLSELPSADDETERYQFESDFANLIGPAGIIVRTSGLAGADKTPNLPRTQGLSPKAAVSWCMDTAAKMSEEFDLSQLAFVAHRFVASRASAWVRSNPDHPIVEIHALWGLPDALQFCPYDTWEVHVPTGVTTDYSDYKSDMLISQADGRWDYVRVRNDLARHNCISSMDAKELAIRSAAISSQMGRSCHIMWFVGCVDTDGNAFNLPWYWTEAHSAEPNHDRSAYRVITVTDDNSLREFENLEGSRDRQALALKPTDLDLMRDNKFIERVGSAASAANVPIILTGSTLAHAYYLLRTKGCSVVTPTEKEHSRIRRKVVLGKLVRDHIPAKIDQRREVNVTKEIPNTLKKGFLVGKLFEEAMEVRGARENEQKIEELSDLFEIVRALAKTEGISLNSIKEAADRKVERSGGFDKGVVLLQTGITSSDQRSSHDIEQRITDLMAEQISEDTIEIPFTFFGFMEFDRARAIMLEHFGIWLQIALRFDRIEIKLLQGPEQLGLPLE